MWFKKRKDGGPESTVTGYFLYENKRRFTVALLRFDNGTRDAFHNHAFNSISWVLRGQLREHFLYKWRVHRRGDGATRVHRPSFRPVATARGDFHQVESVGTTWVLTFRGPWRDTWQEFLPLEDRYRTLTHGRVEVPHAQDMV